MYKPMLATASHLKLDQFPDTWVFEPKFDGIRCQAARGRLWSRAGNDITDRFPEITVSESTVLDGEIVILDAGGVPQFSLVARRTPKNARSSPPATFMAFDVLEIEGKAITQEPLSERRRLLEHVIDIPPGVSVTEQSDDASAMWTAARAAGHEGIMAKMNSSRYVPGRSKSWLKVKKSARLSAIVVGAQPGSGKRAGMVGSLELALLDTNNAPVRIGEVGTGFDNNDLAFLSGLLAQGAPFVVDIEYQEVTEANQLRFPSFKGVRDDLSFLDCTVDQLEGGR